MTMSLFLLFFFLKASLTFYFGQVDAEILPKNKLGTFFVDMVYVDFIKEQNLNHINILFFDSHVPM